MLRLASSKALITSSRIFLSGSITAFRNSQETLCYFSHHLFTESETKSELIESQMLDDHLVKILKSKIKTKQLSPSLQKAMPAVPADFPFTIHEDRRCINLRREFDGEKIEVNVFTESTHTRSLRIYVKSMKENGKELTINFVAYPDDIQISSISSEACYLRDLDEDLKPDFVEFIEIRGIKKSYFEFLYAYMVQKDKRERITSLDELKMFIKEQ